MLELKRKCFEELFGYNFYETENLIIFRIYFGIPAKI